jgi:hypothetical protein
MELLQLKLMVTYGTPSNILCLVRDGFDSLLFSPHTIQLRSCPWPHATKFFPGPDRRLFLHKMFFPAGPVRLSH